MTTSSRFLVLGLAVLLPTAAMACEPVLPLMQVMVPASLYDSVYVLIGAVVLKSLLFAVFERRLPHLRATWRMLLGNVLTTFVGVLAAVMIASSPGTWLIGVPIVYFLCWPPSRRLVKAAPLAWLARTSPAVLAGIMTSALLASCILFMVGQGALGTNKFVLFWIIQLAAIFLALVASMTLTTVWEEWVIWRLSSRPDGTGFFASALRANLYVLLLLMLVPAALILPKRLHSPGFLAQTHNAVASQRAASHPSSDRLLINWIALGK